MLRTISKLPKLQQRGRNYSLCSFLDKKIPHSPKDDSTASPKSIYEYCLDCSSKQQLKDTTKDCKGNDSINYSDGFEDLEIIHAKIMQTLKQKNEKAYRVVDMMTGILQVKFLKQLIEITNSKKVLEIGTFLGYGTTALLQGVFNNSLNNTTGVFKVSTIERDTTFSDIAKDNLSKYLLRGHTISEQKNYCTQTRQLSGGNTEEISSFDVGKVNVNLILGDAVSSLENMPQENYPYDFVYMDAKKSEYINYLKTLLDNQQVTKNGIIVTDNVLFGGQVVNPESNKYGKIMHEFNRFVKQESRVDAVMLPVFDGISILKVR